MLGLLDDLDGRLVADRDVGVLGQGHLGEADGAGVRPVAGPEELDDGDHLVGHVDGPVVGAVGAVANIDLDVCPLVAAEPAGLEGDGAAGCWPVRAVRGRSDAATWGGEG